MASPEALGKGHFVFCLDSACASDIMLPRMDETVYDSPRQEGIPGQLPGWIRGLQGSRSAGSTVSKEEAAVMHSKTKADRQTQGMPMPGAKALIIAVVVLGLTGIILFATLHEKGSSPPPEAGASSGLAPLPPPLTAAEESYAAALWPIHSDVKLSAVLMTFAGLSYKLGELDRNGLQARLGELVERFAAAADRLSQVLPPASLQTLHGEYVEALQLYQAATVEMVRVVDDGRDEHLLDAQAQSEKAAAILLKLSDALWPGEYKPN